MEISIVIIIILCSLPQCCYKQLSIISSWYFMTLYEPKKKTFPGRWYWFCSNCENFYNRELIEQGLIDAVQRRSMAFVLQDLVCTKCHGVS